MTGKLKILGLALVATLALGATTASTASAIYELHSESAGEKTYLKAKQITESVLDVPNSTGIKCTTVEGEGSFAGTTSFESVISNIVFEGCSAFGLQAHIDMMNCDFRLTGSGTESGVVHIECPTTAGGVTDKITVTPTQGGAAICHVDIPEQSPTFAITNNGGPPNDIENSLSEATLSYSVERTVGGAKCPANGNYSNGKLTNQITVTAFQDEEHKEPVGLTYE